MYKFNKKKFFEEIFLDFKKFNRISNVDLHVHTNWTDGKNSIMQVARTAKKKKLYAILFSEHSRKTSGDWFNKFVNEIKKAQAEIGNSCKLIIGTEVKVLDFQGNLDLSPKIKKKCDLIMSSVHRFPGEQGNIFENKKNFSQKEALTIEFELLKAAIKYSESDIIGHPFGMCIKRFKLKPHFSYFQKIIKECSKNNKIFEINYHYHTNYRQLLDECVKSRTLFSLGSNAHLTKEIGKINSI